MELRETRICLFHTQKYFQPRALTSLFLPEKQETGLRGGRPCSGRKDIHTLTARDESRASPSACSQHATALLQSPLPAQPAGEHTGLLCPSSGSQIPRGGGGCHVKLMLNQSGGSSPLNGPARDPKRDKQSLTSPTSPTAQSQAPHGVLPPPAGQKGGSDGILSPSRCL